jgi:hypothetical protein
MSTFDPMRYFHLQTLRHVGSLTDSETEELQDLAMQKLFIMIESDPDLLAVFKRLKDR